MTDIVQLEQCQSTQDEVRARLVGLSAGSVVVVRAARQLVGRGRAGRRWQQPPGEALLVSIGAAGPLPPGVLFDLPADIAQLLLAELSEPGAVCWKAPNDLVAARDGAKVCGILVDARSTGDVVDEVIVGVGCNLTGGAFTTSDGRAATSLEALDAALDADRFIARVAQRLTTSVYRRIERPGAGSPGSPTRSS